MDQLHGECKRGLELWFRKGTVLGRGLVTANVQLFTHVPSSVPSTNESGMIRHLIQHFEGYGFNGCEIRRSADGKRKEKRRLVALSLTTNVSGPKTDRYVAKL